MRAYKTLKWMTDQFWYPDFYHSDKIKGLEDLWFSEQMWSYQKVILSKRPNEDIIMHIERSKWWYIRYSTTWYIWISTENIQPKDYPLLSWVIKDLKWLGIIIVNKR